MLVDGFALRSVPVLASGLIETRRMFHTSYLSFQVNHFVLTIILIQKLKNKSSATEMAVDNFHESMLYECRNNEMATTVI